MKLRHTAALALVGWYLMLPPAGQASLCDPDAPISRWKIVRSFDRADDCKDVYVRGVKTYEGQKDRSECAKAALCIASDDPRLKEK